MCGIAGILSPSPNIISAELLDKMGKAMDVDTKIEFCAALKNEEEVEYAVYEKKDGDFGKVDAGKTTMKYFGGSDACQGDSGGPL